MKRNKKLVNEQINLEKKRVLNNKKGNKLHFNENKEIHYTKKFPDNKSVFYYPLKKNFMSDEEEKKYNHYYGEEFIDRVSRIDHSGKKETYLQDDLISNLVFLYLLTSKTSEKELFSKIKTTFKIKSCTRLAVINRIKILYDRYHEYSDENKSEKQFWYMSCKMHENKNILTLFQNNKQLYCNIDNIYDCSFHSNFDPNFDNPSSYDQIKYLKSYKKLLEFSLYNLFGNCSNNNINNQDINDMVIEEQSGNDIISNASSKMLSYSNSKETEEIVNEIIIECMDGKIICLNKKKDLENLEINNDSLKNHITDLAYEFNQVLKNIKCQNNIVPQIKKIKGIEKEDKKPCSELCYKNFLNCEEKLHDDTYSALKDKQFPKIYELLLIKFFLILKFDPCHICKLMKVFLKDIPNFKLNCTDIYIHLLSKQFNLKKVIKKELFDLNLKERELSKKNKASLTPAQTKKIEENNLKSMNLNYVPCIHFGNEVCDDKCGCSKRGFCEVFCRCNKILCKSSLHGCHCFKGDCTSNHCPCFINGRECNPQRCKNCNIQKYEEIRCKNLKLQMDFESKLIVGISPISGWGLFSNEFIKKDSLIGEYKGELITDEIVNKRDKFREYENSTYMFKLDYEYTIDSRKMGNLLRYANHSKINSNSYTKIVFSEGQRKIVLISKRDIFKGEEILFDYDGQGILGKQFSWINDDKNILGNKENNSNNHKAGNSQKKEVINQKSSSIMAIKSPNAVITIEDNDESTINNDKKEIIINSCFNNIINNNINIINNTPIDSKVHNINDIINDDNIGKKVDKILINNDISNQEKKDEKINNDITNDNKIIKPIFQNPLIKKENNENQNQKDSNKNNQKNLIDILSEGNFNFKSNNNTKNANNNQKIVFKTEEDDIITLRNKFKKGNETNIFDWMSKIGENLDKNNKLLNKKRNLPNPIENKIQTKLDLNFNFSNPDNSNTNLQKNVFPNNEKKNELNLEIADVNPYNQAKLKKPVFASESLEESNKFEKNNFLINNKIKYNFFTYQNLNIIDANNKNNQENEINNSINSPSNFNQSSKSNKNNISLSPEKQKKPKSNKFYNIGLIRIILEFDNNPIINDFKFFSQTNTDILKNIHSIKCKTLNLNNSSVDVILDKDIYGYLNNNINNKGFRIFSDYLNLYDNMAYYCFIPEINSDIYFISNGPLFDKIKEEINFKNGKFKKLLFFIKKKSKY